MGTGYSVIIRGLHLDIKNAEALKCGQEKKAAGEGGLERVRERCGFGEHQEAG